SPVASSLPSDDLLRSVRCQNSAAGDERCRTARAANIAAYQGQGLDDGSTIQRLRSLCACLLRMGCTARSAGDGSRRLHQAEGSVARASRSPSRARTRAQFASTARIQLMTVRQRGCWRTVVILSQAARLSAWLVIPAAPNDARFLMGRSA